MDLMTSVVKAKVDLTGSASRPVRKFVISGVKHSSSAIADLIGFRYNNNILKLESFIKRIIIII